MNQEEKRVANRLVNEKSPYLLQHAYNPVHWFPWGEEAFAKAKAEDKPIFLSIGYSTCHWCHVMERESFEDDEVAALLNDEYISIKVDKEERPDIDTIYMSVCQAMNGHGGWPLTILMTPEQKPFFAGTYLPKQSNGQMIGLMQLLTTIAALWKNEKHKLLDSGEEITRLLKSQEREQGNRVTPDKRLFGMAYLSFRSQFDSKYGGFGNAPKFPTPHHLLFLLRYAVEYKEEKALQMVEKTLEDMYRGGIYDHIGGGFSRYSTDDAWLVPHFEKMLYDNALLVIAYAEAYQITKNPLYEVVIRETLQYIMEELTDDMGGFYCAQDADSEGEEGKYYVFSQEEVMSLLGEKYGSWFNEQYDITPSGNFEGENIPNRIHKENLVEVSKESKQMRRKLYEYRQQRRKLHKDDKILTSWNSLMITAFTKAFQVLGDEFYLRAAKKAYQFICQDLQNEQGRLFIRYRDGHRQGFGNLEDYSFFIMAQLSLYEVTFDPAYLIHASKDADQMIDLFWDEEQSGFYYYGTDSETLLLRPKEVYDGAIPSGNSVAAYGMVKLAMITRKDRYLEIAKRQLDFLAGEIGEYPSSYTFSLCAMMLEIMDKQEIVCVLSNKLDMDDLKQILRENYLPNTVIVAIEEETKESLGVIAPYVLEYQFAKDNSQIYICENFSCHAPLNGVEALKAYLEVRKK